MKVFKFGGASIKDSAAIRNMAGIVSKYASEPLIVVVSAMGKMTNAFEALLHRNDDPESMELQLENIAAYHLEIANDLFQESEIQQKIRAILENVRELMHTPLPYNEWYDQVVSHGEILSSTLVNEWFREQGIAASWVDARKCIHTDDSFREGKVDWTKTKKALEENVTPVLSHGIVVTQGFLGGTAQGKTTTLGREGSDFTAAIIAACLMADSVTVWKDVDGIMNGDPKKIKNTRKIDVIPYHEAAEMTYYGASVIHPKTIKPLANGQIPLYVRSFYHPDDSGTVIRDMEGFDPIPVIILKEDQCLVSFYVRDFTFVNEQNVSMIFHQLAEMDVKINMMQNSAISFSICFDYDESKLQELMERLKGQFGIRFNKGLTLVTVKHYTREYLDEYRAKSNVLLEQITRNTFQILIEPQA